MHNDVKMTAHICDVRLSVVTSALQTSHFPCYCLVCIYVLDATKSADKLSISFRRICEIKISTNILKGIIITPRSNVISSHQN